MDDYARIEKAIHFISENRLTQPTLEEIAAHAGLSPHHFQRLFTRWAGVSPKRYMQFLTIESAREMLSNSASVLETSFGVGLSGPSRLHDLFVSVDAVTPGEYKSGGGGINIKYGFYPTPFGECLLATTERGICALEFVSDRETAVSGLRGKWPNSAMASDGGSGAETAEQIFGQKKDEKIRIFIKGTNFQLKIWEALLKIPEGCLISYGSLSARLGISGSARAVGTAIGQNPIGYLIPCHRVLRSDGSISGYRWGQDRKKAIIAYEASKLEK